MARGSAPADPRRDPPVGGSSPACIRCGCCCHADEPSYIRVFEVDWARMDERARALAVEVAGQRAMRFIDGRCAALERDGSDHRARCAIHEQRPDCCRWLVPDSGACREQQRTKGPRALELARAAR